MLASELVGEYWKLTSVLEEEERELAMVMLLCMLSLVADHGGRFIMDIPASQLQGMVERKMEGAK
jgi:hypothetical protein